MDKRLPELPVEVECKDDLVYMWVGPSCYTMSMKTAEEIGVKLTTALVRWNMAWEGK